MQALGDVTSIVNVGAGTGSYEPAGARLVAVEPAWAMIGQRPRAAAPVVQAAAGDLPFRDAAFAAALAVLTIHHWPDRARGLAELRRVASHRIVALTWDPAASGFWLVEDYFPEIAAIDRAIFPALEEFECAWGPTVVQTLPVPHDCVDGFTGAYWRRPAAYLDDAVRAGMSTFARLPIVEPGLAQLRRDLENGAWIRRHRRLLERAELDVGYRLVAAGAA